MADAVDPDNICKITEEVAYWRKANQIHRWFVENVQQGEDDCREYLVDTEDLKKLLATVKKVLANRSKADDLLPPQLGFFYGSLEKDEYYFNALEYTRKMLEKTLKKPLVGNQSYYYRASW